MSVSQADWQSVAGHGEVAQLMREHDWSTSPLGQPQTWSASLRAVVSLLLQSKFPMFVAWGPDLGFLYNDAYAQILGAKHPSALGRRFDAIWAEIWTEISPLIQSALSGQATFQQDMPLVMNRNGFDEQTWFTFSYSPAVDDDGQVRGMFCAVQETTSQVIARRRDAFRISLEKQLRDLSDPLRIMAVASEALGRELGISRVGYGEIDATARDVIVERDWTDGRLSSVAGRYRMDDFGPEIIAELRAKRTMWVDDVTTDPRVGVSAGAFAAIGTRSVLAVPLFKEQRFVAMLYLHHPEPHRWDPAEVALAQDIVEQTWQAVERARAEAQLRSLNENLERRIAEAVAERDALEEARRAADALYRAYFQHAPEALFVVAVTPDEDFVVEEVNPAHEASVGFRIEEIRGKRLKDFLPAETHEKVVQAYQRVLQSGEAYHYRDAFQFNGQMQYWDSSIVPVRDTTGRISRLIGSSRDITRQVVAEEALRQSQKMEAMGQLTGGVAHDFNNLLTPILGSLDMLQRRGIGSEREQKLVAGALQSAERARTLVQRLLAFARRQPLQPTPIHLGRLVTEMAELLSSTIGPQIALSLDIADDLPAALAEANQLEMALLNLVVNARDAMPSGGTIRISVSAQKVASPHRAQLKPGNYIRLSVADTGTGMDRATLGRAIEPFFSTKGLGRGTGLGLSMVHGLASQLGGSMTISSQPGVGTNVEIWLPTATAAEAPSKSEDRVEPTATNAARRTILLVDDEDLVRTATAEMLMDLGFQVIEANSAKQALGLLEGGLIPDFLVTDHLMPGMTGTELAREVRTRGLPTKLLLVSGYADLEGLDPDVPRLPKPFRRTDLEASLDALGSAN